VKRKIQLDSFGHIGVVVKNIDATIMSWESLLGAGPFKISGGGDLKLAHGMAGGQLFELLQPLENKSLWAKFLAVHGEGIHHVCSYVPDVDAAVATLLAQGGKHLIGGMGAWAYVEIGGPGSIIMELLKTPAIKHKESE
jgi:catechol 2,3-dioxygenase-like lactoylglutathione lyase family enzyme